MGALGFEFTILIACFAGAAAWYLFAAGVFLNATGILVAAILGRTVGPEALTTPAVADSFWIALYPWLAAGIVLLIRRVWTSHDKTTLVDTVIITTALALLSWVFVIRPRASDPTVTLLARMVIVAYPIGDIVLLALIVRLILAGRGNHSLRLLVAALCCFLGADIGWAIFNHVTLTPELLVQRSPALMPAASMILCHFAVSDLSRAPNSSGELCRASTPCAIKALRSSGFCMTLVISALSLAITAGGTPFGTRMPSQPVASKSL